MAKKFAPEVREEFKRLKRWVQECPIEAAMRIEEVESKNEELIKEISYLNQAIGKYYGIFTNHADSINTIEKELRESAIELMKTK